MNEQVLYVFDEDSSMTTFGIHKPNLIMLDMGIAEVSKLFSHLAMMSRLHSCGNAWLDSSSRSVFISRILKDGYDFPVVTSEQAEKSREFSLLQAWSIDSIPIEDLDSNFVSHDWYRPELWSLIGQQSSRLTSGVRLV